MSAGAWESTIRDYERHVSRGLARLARMMGAPLFVEARGCRLRDQEGREYLDCGGYGLFLVGHGHPKLVAEATAQLDRLAQTGPMLFNPWTPAAARELAEVAPQGLEYVHFVNSGAEAVETALKLARLNGAARLVATAGGYHGKTLGALSVTGRSAYRQPFQPLLPDVSFVPFGSIEALAVELAARPEPACVIVEPIQAEGGVRIPPASYLRAVHELCAERGAFLVVDEIQTGIGRLGDWFACSAESLRPDVLLAGKGLGGGLVPVGAAIASERAHAPLGRDPMLHTSTFGGSPLACAVVSAMLRLIRDEDVLGRVKQLSPRLEGVARAACQDHAALVREVRCRGLLLGIEMTHEYLAGDLVLELLERQIVVSSSANAYGVVRLTPSVDLDDADLDRLGAGLRGALRAIAERHRPDTGEDRR